MRSRLLSTCISVVVVFGCQPAESDSPVPATVDPTAGGETAGDVPRAGEFVPPALVATGQESGTEALLQAVSPVDEDVVWVSGHEATYARTFDGGETWYPATVLGADGLQFRDVHAFDSRSAYLMSAGTGDQSRIYRTDDGGASWSLQYTADHPEAFLDCLAFWSPDRGLAYGDAVDGVPFILSTEDGGATWSRIPRDALPAALDGEGGFAASGTCLIVGAGGRAFVATGNGDRPRVLRTDDYGVSWTAHDVPVVGGTASGLTTIQIDGRGVGFALGGVIGGEPERTRNVAVTVDDGRTWTEAGRLAMLGPAYGSSQVPGSFGLAIAVGPGGLDWSIEGGRVWYNQSETTYWAVAFASADAGWAVGPEGRITKLSLADRMR